jgi:hypothetical protein
MSRRKVVPVRDRCTCCKKLEVIEMVSNYATIIATHFLDNWVVDCPELTDLAIDQLMARLVHIQILTHDENIEDRELMVAVEKVMLRASKRLPAILASIIEEARQREKTHASN